MKKIIHIDESPITSYPSIANMLSMAWGKKEELLPWLSDHFVQLVVRPHHDTRIDYYDHADLDNNYRKIYGMPGYSWMRNNTDTIKTERFTDYIEFAVDHEYCLEPCLDNFYFSFSNCYQKHHYIHSTFIYGYDNEEEIVYAADFWELGKYSTKMINYNEINQSFNNEGIVNLFRYYKAEYEFNKKLLISSCRDYLSQQIVIIYMNIRQIMKIETLYLVFPVMIILRNIFMKTMIILILFPFIFFVIIRLL